MSCIIASLFSLVSRVSTCSTQRKGIAIYLRSGGDVWSSTHRTISSTSFASTSSFMTTKMLGVVHWACQMDVTTGDPGLCQGADRRVAFMLCVSTRSERHVNTKNLNILICPNKETLPVMLSCLRHQIHRGFFRWSNSKRSQTLIRKSRFDKTGWNDSENVFWFGTSRNAWMSERHRVCQKMIRLLLDQEEYECRSAKLKDELSRPLISKVDW